MDAFYERLIVRAATIDELLSQDFEPLPDRKGDADTASQRLAAWCRSAATGDRTLFEQRLQRDHLTVGQVLARFSGVRRGASVAAPAWVDGAIWIERALQSPGCKTASTAPDQAEACAFEHMFAPLVEQAEARLWSGIDASAADNLAESARASLRHLLLTELTGLCAPALYERFAKLRKTA